MKTILILILIAGIAGYAPTVSAQPQQSENFRITKSVLDAGGGASTSTNFHLISAFGQPTPIGVSSSANFTLYSGFLTPTFAVSPASPIDLVIRRQPSLSNDMKLDWSAVSGATRYTIYRNVNPVFVPTSADSVGSSNTNTFVDVGALSLPAVKYFYIVEAVGGSSPAARPGEGLTRVTMPAPSSGTSIQPAFPAGQNNLRTPAPDGASSAKASGKSAQPKRK